MYVSITGLKVRSWIQVPLFWRHAIPSMQQAKAAPGNLFADVRKVAGVQHTLTVWENRAAMRAYLTSGAHLAAIRAFRSIGSGKVCGYEAERQPSWDEALAYWQVNGREY
jgi:quinol monooxygenase YgiN